MKLLNVIHFLNPYEGGGSVDRIHKLSKYLVKSKYDVSILTTNYLIDELYLNELSGVDLHLLPFFSNRFKIPIGLILWLSKNIKKFDIVHLSMNYTIINVFTYFFLRVNNIPYIFSSMGWIRIDGRLKFIKLIYNIFITSFICKNAEYCIAINQNEVLDYISIGVSKNKIKLIPNGVDSSFYKQDIKLDFNNKFKLDDRKIILFVGRLNKIKGIDLLINAFARLKYLHKHYQLVIIGNHDGYENLINELIEINNLHFDVKLLGPLIGFDKLVFYKLCEFIVIPSRFDTMTIVALEAAASGTLIMISKNCYFKEITESVALEISPNVDSLCSGILSMIYLDEETKIKLKKDGLDFIQTNYDWSIISDLFIEVFDKILLGKPPINN
jgi:glycosyltransferase involved in cell wall biosynthesis